MGHLHDVEPLHLVEDQRGDVGHRHEPQLDERPLHPGLVRADVDLEVSDPPLLAAHAHQVAEHGADDLVPQRDQLEDAHGVPQGVVREADGPGDPPALARDQVARSAGPGA